MPSVPSESKPQESGSCVHVFGDLRICDVPVAAVSDDAAATGFLLGFEGMGNCRGVNSGGSFMVRTGA